MSEALLGELENVLLRPGFRRYLAENETPEYSRRLEHLATIAPDPRAAARLTLNPKDKHLAVLARSSHAHR